MKTLRFVSALLIVAAFAGSCIKDEMIENILEVIMPQTFQTLGKRYRDAVIAEGPQHFEPKYAHTKTCCNKNGKRRRWREHNVHWWL